VAIVPRRWGEPIASLIGAPAFPDRRGGVLFWRSSAAGLVRMLPGPARARAFSGGVL